MPLPPTRESIEETARKFHNFGVGQDGKGAVIIRSGELGAYLHVGGDSNGTWIDAYHQDASRVVDVTGECAVMNYGTLRADCDKRSGE